MTKARSRHAKTSTKTITHHADGPATSSLPADVEAFLAVAERSGHDTSFLRRTFEAAQRETVVIHLRAGRQLDHRPYATIAIAADPRTHGVVDRAGCVHVGERHLLVAVSVCSPSDQFRRAHGRGLVLTRMAQLRKCAGAALPPPPEFLANAVRLSVVATVLVEVMSNPPETRRCMARAGRQVLRLVRPIQPNGGTLVKPMSDGPLQAHDAVLKVARLSIEDFNRAMADSPNHRRHVVGVDLSIDPGHHGHRQR